MHWLGYNDAVSSLRLRVMRLILNIIFSGAIIVFGLLIHNNASFHLMVSISDEYKYKRLVKTTFKSCGKPMFFEIYYTRNCIIRASDMPSLFIKNTNLQRSSAGLTY